MMRDSVGATVIKRTELSYELKFDVQSEVSAYACTTNKLLVQ